MSEDISEDSGSHVFLIEFLKWPIVFLLMFTSVPAGFLPFGAAGAYRALQHDEQLHSKWRSPARIASGHRMLRLMLLASAVAGVIHVAMAEFARRKWHRKLFGLSGAAWFAMIWIAFAVGMGFGLWIYLVAPE